LDYTIFLHTTPSDHPDHPGDQFAHWAIVYIEQFLKITEIAQVFELLFS
jgi:hypothetical protein